MAQTPIAASLKCAALYPRPAQGQLARQSSPSAVPPAAFPRKNSPSKRKNAEFGVL